MISQAELILRVITLWLLVLSQLFFRDGMGLFNLDILNCVYPFLPHSKIRLIYPVLFTSKRKLI